MKSKKTKVLISRRLGFASLAMCVCALVDYDLTAISCIASLVFGIAAIAIGSPYKPNLGYVLGWVGTGLTLFILPASLFMFLTVISYDQEPCLRQAQTLRRMINKYSDQTEGHLPDADIWFDQLLKSIEDVESIYMKAFPVGYDVDAFSDFVNNKSVFALNKNLDGYIVSEINRKTVLLFETDLGRNQSGTSAALASERHIGYWPFFKGGYHFVFVGPGSTFTVEFVKNSEIDSLNWEPAK